MTPLTITSLDQGRALGRDAWTRLAETADQPAPPPDTQRPTAPGLLARLLRRLSPQSAI